MYFRNLTMFRIPRAQCTGLRNLAGAVDEGNLQDWLSQHTAKPAGPLELSSRGWVAPFGSGSDALFHQVGDCLWLTLGGEDKILPASAVNAELAKRLKAIEDREGRKLGGQARKQLKDDVIHELLPKALVKPYRLNGYVDLARGVVFVDTSSRKQAEGWVSQLRHTLGSFPALPVNAEAPVNAVLTGWLAGETAGMELDLGDEAELHDPVDGGGVVKVSRLEFPCDEIQSHIEAGLQVVRLGLQLGDRLTFTFGEDLAVRKLKLLDVVIDKLDSTERDSLEAELDARFALLAGEVGQLFDVLEQAFRLSKAEEQAGKHPELADEDHDPLYQAAIEAVVGTGRASVSTVQRVLKIGYNRAARLIEAMEQDGVVSAPNARGERQVLSAKVEG